MEATLNTSEVREWKRFDELRPLPLDWELHIPSHWRTHRLKEVANARPSNVDKKSVDAQDDVLLCNYVDVYKNERITAEIEFMKATASESQIGQFSIKADDVIITKDSEAWDDIGVPAFVPEAIENLVCGYHLTLISPDPSTLSGAYLARCLESDGLRDQFRIAANGVTRYGLNTQDICCFVVPIPPLTEQRAIAAFLDRETERIDALIGHKQRLIDLLEEKRQAVISHAVTQGLDPDVEIKDSGKPWLGKVPKHWNVKSLKFLIEEGTSISYGIVQPGENIPNGLPFVQTTNMTSGDFSLSSMSRTTEEIAAAYPRSRIMAGDLLLGIRASVGAAHIVPPHLEGANLSRGVARIVLGQEIISGYLCEFLRAQCAQDYWLVSQQGSTFNEVSIANVRELPVLVPPPEEQEAIVDAINQRCSPVLTVSSTIQGQIGLLQEYRTALISAAVTGQIDVREEVELDG